MAKNFRSDPNYPILREFKAGLDVPELLRRHGAHAMGIAPKVSEGEQTTKLALTFYVAAKRSEDELSGVELVPNTYEFTPQKDTRRRRITTDVVEAPPATFEYPDPESRIRPVPGGVSGGINGSTGTIGGWVWDTTDDTIVMLSNHHVFGHTAGTDILQPGTADGGSLPGDKIGDVKRGVVRTTSGTNTVDAAIGDPDDSSIYDLEVLDIGPAVYATDEAVVEMEVEKFGQTTEHTYGKIISVDYSTLVDGVWFFEDCLRIEPISPSSDWSAGGDSGSLVFRQEPTTEGGSIQPVVGLHFAGGGIYGVACKIENVFADLDLTNLCTGAFQNFLDSLGETEAETEGEPTFDVPVLPSAALRRATMPQVDLRPRVPALARASTFTRKERFRASALNPARGLSRDVQTRLRTTRTGRKLTDAVDVHRGELLSLLTRNGDVRRSAVAALRPLTRGAVTTSDVFRRIITEDDIDRFERLADAVGHAAKEDLANIVDDLRALTRGARGKTLGELFDIDG